MQNFCSVINSLFVALLLTVTAVASDKFNFGKGYIDDELLVKYTNGAMSEAAQTANLQVGASVVQNFPDLGWQLVRLPENLTVEQALTNYNSFAGVEAAQPNYIYRLAQTPNDPSYGSLYGMTKIDAPAAWNTTTGSPSVVVADIDTGIRYTHEDLAANVWRNPGEIPGNGIDDDGDGFVDDYYGYDFFSNDGDPLDENGHGTHTAGTIGAVGNNAKGVTGVSWNVSIMSVKIYDAAGNSTSSILINAYNYVRLMKNRGVNIRATNNSYGDCAEACGYDQATKDAIDALGNSDVLQVFAAGNNGRNIEPAPFYPASYTTPSILAVAASDSADNKASFSNYGAMSVDLAAPGVGVLSTYRNSDASYTSLSGTSMATPHTTGAAALLAAANPNLSAASLKATLMNTVTPLANWNGVVKSGGRLNIANAIQNQTVCSFILPATMPNVPVAGGSFSINVTAAANCDFAAISQNNWITVTSGNPGSGNTTVNYTVAANTGAIRASYIQIAGQNFPILQLGTINLLSRAVLDFDNDGRTDFSAIQNSGGTMLWHNLQSTNGYNPVNFGFFSGDIPVPADYDGDGKADVAVWRGGSTGGQGVFYVLNSSNGTFRSVNWGTAGDVPLMAEDFDGDGKADFVVTRAVNNQLVWFILKSTGGFASQQFGFSLDKPLRGDFDGDGKADLAVYRPANLSPANTFFVLKSSTGMLLTSTFGDSTTDRIISGDFDGDGRTDFAVWRSTTGVWYWLNSSNGALRAVQFGANGDLPTPGDYDGDGKTDISVWRPNSAPNQSGTFYVNGSTSGFSAVPWGQSGMLIPAAY